MVHKLHEDHATSMVQFVPYLPLLDTHIYIMQTHKTNTKERYASYKQGTNKIQPADKLTSIHWCISVTKTMLQAWYNLYQACTCSKHIFLYCRPTKQIQKRDMRGTNKIQSRDIPDTTNRKADVDTLVHKRYQDHVTSMVQFVLFLHLFETHIFVMQANKTNTKKRYTWYKQHTIKVHTRYNQQTS
jgi:hypothetical protein